MNGVPTKFDYSKTINEQLPTFEYYKDKYRSYELKIMRLQQENKKYKEVIDKLNKYLDDGYLINTKDIKDILEEVE